MSALADDAAAAMDALQMPRAIVVGFSMGFQVALELARLHRQRVAGLVSLAGASGRPLDSFMPGPFSGLAARALPRILGIRARAPRLFERAWSRALPSPWVHDVAMRVGVDAANVEPADMELYLRHMSDVSPRVFLGMLEAAQAHCADDVLPDIRVPTLICAGGRDGFVPAARLRDMVDAIPNAWWRLFPEATHALPAERPREIHRAIESIAVEAA
jgi:pimeloyl-ACP methyl ester carboxylesterase